MTNIPGYLPPVLKEYVSQEDFFKNISDITPNYLLCFLEQMNNNWDERNTPFINGIITHLNTKAFEGELTLALARRVSLAFNKFFLKVPPADLNNSNSRHQTPYIDPLLLISSSSIFKTMQDKKINLDVDNSTQKYLKEFLETGRIMEFEQLDKNKPLPAAHAVYNLIGFGKNWKMTELLDYMADFVPMDQEVFEFLLESSLSVKASKLFERCIQFKFSDNAYKITINNFKDIVVEICAHTFKSKEKLDSMCQFLNQLCAKEILPAINSFEVQFIRRFLKQTKNLSYSQRFNDAITKINFFQDNISIEEIMAFAQQCKNLHVLILPHIFAAWEIEQLNVLVEKCAQHPNFKSIQISFRQDIKLKDIRTLQNYPELMKLFTSITLTETKITDEEISFLTQDCPNLILLNLTSCSEISDASLKMIAENCRNLTSLNLSFCGQITPQGLTFLAEGCRNLISLNLTDSCLEMTDDVLKIFVESHKRLEQLYLSHYNLTDNGLMTIANECSNLQALDLVNSSKISDKGLKALSQGCPKLVEVSIRYCNKITNLGLKTLILDCPNIHWLDLIRCDKINVEGIIMLADIASKINCIKLNTSIGAIGIEYLKKKHPGIIIENR